MLRYRIVQLRYSWNTKTRLQKQVQHQLEQVERTVSDLAELAADRPHLQLDEVSAADLRSESDPLETA